MGFKYPIEEHVTESMMVQVLKNGILNRTICCSMNCSKKEKHALARGGRRSHATLRCCWQKKVLFSIHVKTFYMKGH